MQIALGLYYYVLLACALFSIGIFGLIANRNSLISVLISSEIILLAANVNLVSVSSFSNNIDPQIFSFFILAVAAAEVAVGLAITLVYFSKKGSINISGINTIYDV